MLKYTFGNANNFKLQYITVVKKIEMTKQLLQKVNSIVKLTKAEEKVFSHYWTEKA